MQPVVAMLRAVNVGGRNKLPMDALRELVAGLGFGDPRTFIQSGNIVFHTEETDMARLAERLAEAIERRFGFRPGAICRTAGQMRATVANNPFAANPCAGRVDINPASLIVHFLAAEPSPEHRTRLAAFWPGPEEVRLCGPDLYVHYPIGQGKSKLTPVQIEKAAGVSATGRNWNTVLKLLEMAES